jgi:predicted amidohydrolase YtcJ
MPASVVFRDVEVAGRAGLDVHVSGGAIVAVGKGLKVCCEEIDGRGGALIPGLIDHHLHLMSWAAQLGSVDLSNVETPAQLRQALHKEIMAQPAGAWIRATGYHDKAAGVLTRFDLDTISATHKLRIQHRSGALWMLNSLALEAVLGAEPAPDSAGRGPGGQLNGQFRRADAWLRERLTPLDLPIHEASQALARWGVTGFTDASVTNDARAARLISEKKHDGSILQRVMLMGAPTLPAAPDESALPDIDHLAGAMREAHAGGRAVATHCVTLAELAVTLAAMEAAGVAPGDRIEHGGEITDSGAGAIQRLGLTVVTQPAFIHGKGDRYMRECEEPELLYRCGSLKRLCVKVAGSSDAPYGEADPWLAMRTARDRRTRTGAVLNGVEAVTAADALSLYLGPFHDPGGPSRRVQVGAEADLCLLAAPMSGVLDALEPALVAVTMVAGKVVYAAERR